jgi:hypothetical protein
MKTWIIAIALLGASANVAVAEPESISGQWEGQAATAFQASLNPVCRPVSFLGQSYLLCTAGGYGSSNEGGRPIESITLNSAGLTFNGIDRKPQKQPEEPGKPIQLAGLTATAAD